MVVSGPAKDLAAFEDFAREGENLLSANKFIPYPEKFRLLDEAYKKAAGDHMFPPPGTALKDGFNSGGYEWCVANWGTKWGIYNAKKLKKAPPRIKMPKGSLAYTFETAWSPATTIILAMSERFPALRFECRYYERGVGFQGHYAIKGEEEIANTENGYNGGRGG
jgi:hypothetical protein